MHPAPILLVNADDFGLSPGVNEGIEQAHRLGIVTSASLMVRPNAATDAARIAQRNPALFVGLHVDLCEWIYEGQDWRLAYEVVNLSDPAQVEREVARQFEVFIQLLGRPPTHLDSHQHVHRTEPIRSILTRLATAHAIPLRHETTDLHYCGSFYGQSNRGEPHPDSISVEALSGLIRALPPGATELACHPAKGLDFESVYREERLIELRALCHPAVKEAAHASGARLCGFGDPAVQGLVRRTR